MENVPIYIILGALIVLKAIYFFSFPYAGNITMGTILQTLAGELLIRELKIQLTEPKAGSALCQFLSCYLM